MLELAVATTFVWLGMVLAISFLEAPLKFRVPGISLPVGLALGRLVFRALNGCETVLAALLVLGAFAAAPSAESRVAVVVAVLALAAQILAVRPVLTRRSDAVLANPEGVTGPGSRAHLWYVAFEAVKVVALIFAGVTLFQG